MNYAYASNDIHWLRIGCHIGNKQHSPMYDRNLPKLAEKLRFIS